jgi:hypothetical protein
VAQLSVETQSQSLHIRRKKMQSASHVHVAANAQALINEQYPNLLNTIPKTVMINIQNLLTNRYLIAINRQVAAKYEGSYLATDVARRNAILQEIDKLEMECDKDENKFFELPLKPLLALDILSMPGDTPEVLDWKKELYKYLSQKKIILEVQDGLRPRPLFKFILPAFHVYISQKGGLIRFEDLMRIERVRNMKKYYTGEEFEIPSIASDYLLELGGKSCFLMGKKIGEILGSVDNTDVEIGYELPRGIKRRKSEWATKHGGYYDDKRGQSELRDDLLFYSKVAKIVVRAKDGWLHLYTLEPNIDSWDLTSLNDDGYIYLLAKGGEISMDRVHYLVTADHIYLEPISRIGWRCKDSPHRPGYITQFAVGAFFGDFIKHPSASMVTGQIFTGLIPIVGQIADARDVVAGLCVIWKSGGDNGWIQTLLALVGLFPWFGDRLKAAWKAKRTAGVVSEFEKQSNRLIRELGQKILKNPREVAKHFNLLTPAQKSAVSSMRRAIRAGNHNQLDIFVEELDKAYKNLNKDAAALVRISGGDWNRLGKAIKKSMKSDIPRAKELADELVNWRKNYFEVYLPNKAKKKIANMRMPGTTKKLGNPEVAAPGTVDITSDLDLSFLGPNASTYRHVAERILENDFGANWRKLFNANIYTDPHRMLLFKELPTKFRKGVEKKVMKTSELNVLVSMVRKKVPLDELREPARVLGIPFQAVKKHAAEIERLSAPLKRVEEAKLRLATLRHRLKKATGEELENLHNKILKQNDELANANIELARSPYRRLEIRVDILHSRYVAETNPMKKKALAEEIVNNQLRLNAIEAAGYVTPGAVEKQVLRTRAMRKSAGKTGKIPYEKMSPISAYEDMLAEWGQYQIARRNLVQLDANNIKEIAKYVDRFLVTAGQYAEDFAKRIQPLRQLHEDMWGILKVARRNPAKVGELRNRVIALLAKFDAVSLEMLQRYKNRLPGMKVIRISVENVKQVNKFNQQLNILLREISIVLRAEERSR